MNGMQFSLAVVSQLLDQIVKKDPIPDIQNYMLWFDELHCVRFYDACFLFI